MRPREGPSDAPDSDVVTSFRKLFRVQRNRLSRTDAASLFPVFGFRLCFVASFLCRFTSLLSRLLCFVFGFLCRVVHLLARSPVISVLSWLIATSTGCSEDHNSHQTQDFCVH